MKIEPFQQIAEFYDTRVAHYGHDPRACDYGQAISQIRKFAVLADVFPMTDNRILDIGCGFADYADFLKARFGSVAYTGIDISACMINKARQCHPDLDLRHANLLDISSTEMFDIVNANGIFYLLGGGAQVLMQDLIHRMFVLARKAVAFNSLSTWAPIQELDEFYADPLEVVKFCHQLTPWVTLRHDYMPHDFTVYLYREQQSA